MEDDYEKIQITAMILLLKLKQEIKESSKWFKVVLAISALIYIFLWFFTIHLSFIQKTKGLEPVLPSAPKDSQEYVVLSESLMHGQGLSQAGRLETLRLFGYPLFVGIIKTFGRSYFLVTLVQIMLVFVTALIVRLIGILFSSKSVGEIAATLLLLNPVTMTLALLILTDVLFLFLFVLGFYLIVSIDQEKTIWKTCLSALVFVCAIFVRGMGIFALPIFLTPFLATKVPFRTQLQLMLVTVIFIVLSITPWVIRNYVETGVVAFNSFESVNMSWSIPKFLSVLNNTNEEDETLAFQKATGVPQSAWQDLSWHDIRYSKQINAVGEKIILEHPISYLKFHITTSIPFLFPSSILFMRDAYDSATGTVRPFKYGAINYLTSGNWKAFYENIKEVWWKLAERILWLLALLVAIYSVYINRRKSLTWVFVFIILYLMALAGPAAGPRISFQAWPLMFILFASGGVSLFQKFSRSYSKIA